MGAKPIGATPPTKEPPAEFDDDADDNGCEPPAEALRPRPPAFHPPVHLQRRPPKCEVNNEEAQHKTKALHLQ
jgi:hypothetical protein